MDVGRSGQLVLFNLYPEYECLAYIYVDSSSKMKLHNGNETYLQSGSYIVAPGFGGIYNSIRPEEEGLLLLLLALQVRGFTGIKRTSIR